VGMCVCVQSCTSSCAEVQDQQSVGMWVCVQSCTSSCAEVQDQQSVGMWVCVRSGVSVRVDEVRKQQRVFAAVASQFMLCNIIVHALCKYNSSCFV
jgi:hypothetical protein